MTIQRIRGRRLQAIRREHFQRNPLCVRCLEQGRTTLATELDHIQPLHQGGKDERANRQGLCEAHHVEKSKTERGHEYKPRRAIGIDGYPIIRGGGS